MKISLKITVTLFLLSINVAAQNEGVHTRIHHQYQSIRAMGMGDAFVAIANDYSALFYNPAGLARRTDHQVNLSIEAAASTDFMKFSKDLSDTGKSGTTTAEKYNAYDAFLKQYYGKSFMVRMGLFEGIWVKPHFGVGVIPADLTLEYKIHNNVSPAINLRAFLDTTIALGYGNDIKGSQYGRWSWGVTGKVINRGYFNKQFDAFSLAVDSNTLKKEDAQEGYGIDADLGLLYSPHMPGDGFFWRAVQMSKPTLGIVARNVAETKFSNSFKVINKTATQPPEKLYRVFDIGTKFEMPKLWIFSGRWAVDFKDIGHPNYSTKKGFHAGAEFDWTVSRFWKGNYRVGLNQGYFAFGLSAMLGIFNLDLASYAEEVGTPDNPQSNRQYAVKMNMDF